MKRMLFNATQSEELRVAIVNDNKLEDLDFERGNKEQRKSNIYKATITRVEPSLEAAFVNYGVDRHGFLPFKEISPEYYSKKTRKKDISIKDVISEGQQLIIQVTKEERGNKGAALTSYLSLAGRYIVLMPNNNDGGGISRRIEGEERSSFKDVLSQVKIKKGTSVIGRTAGIGATVEQIQWDLDYLSQLWDAIENAANAQEGPFLIYQESNLVIRAIRDYFSTDIEEVLIDKKEIYDQALQFMSHVMPNYSERIKLYDEDTSLFTKFNIENQIESAFLREVQLPSGGAIVIDHTEALVSVDVNSSRSTKGRDIESTAYNTNLEAADELAKQLRFRDIGGLIVIDFIDMENSKHQREVENRIRDSLKQDKARIQIGKISRFGLLELSRQRLRPSIGESVNGACPRCQGTGRVRDIQSTALFIFRLIQEEANKESSQSIAIQLPVEVATLLLNEKRKEIVDIESKTGNEVVIIPNRYLEIPKYDLQKSSKKLGKASYAIVEPPLEVENKANEKNVKEERLEPAVKAIMPSRSAQKGKNSSIFGFFKNLITNGADDTDTKAINKSPDQEATIKTNDNEIEIEKERLNKSNRPRNNNNRNRNRNRRPNNGVNKPGYEGNVNQKDNATNEHIANNSTTILDNPKASIKESPKAKETTPNKPYPAPAPSSKANPPPAPKPKRQPLPKVDLAKIGLSLVETKQTKATEVIAETKKPTKKKVAGWQKKTKDVATGKIEMVETKNKSAKPKPAAKPKLAAKPKKVTSK